jgi:dolichyl-phosphate-mannose-protein mannosyltransferase
MKFSTTIALAILFLSILTRFLPYPSTPTDSTAWDEAYFIPQTESYITGRYFFDPHPPFARMFMVWGTLLFNPSAKNIIDTEALVDHKDGYKSKLNLEGVRFFPKVFGTFVPLLLFLITLKVLEIIYKKQTEVHSIFALLVGLMAVFENTFILESRIAVMTQIMLCMILLTLYLLLRYYSHIYVSKKAKIIDLIVLGVVFGCAFGTKWLAASLLVVLIPLIIFKEIKNGHNMLKNALRSLKNLAVIFFAFSLVYLSLFIWHFNKFTTYTEKADETTTKYVEDLKSGTNKTSFLEKFTTAYRLKLKYEENVPKLDYAKDDENGSYWINWPIMARTISYYWSTPGDGTYRFIYLIGNPFVWLMGLLGIIGLTSIVVSNILTGKGNVHRVDVLLLVLYYANWLPFAFIERVMYLYHYVPALAISFILFIRLLEGYIIPRIHTLLPKLSVQIITNTLVSILLAGTLLSFISYAPFTYATRVSKKQFEALYILKDWHMKWPGN